MTTQIDELDWHEMSANVRRFYNDLCRCFPFLYGQWELSDNVKALPEDLITRLKIEVMDYVDFNPDNDPWKEHDKGWFKVDGEQYMWAIDWYEPSEPTLTILTPSEY